MAIYGIFSSAQFNPYGKKKMFIVLAELHTFEAAKHWLPQLQEIFAPRIVELHPPFIRDRVKNQYRGRSKVYTGWTPPPRKKLTPEMRAGQKARLDTLVGGAEGLIYRIGTI